MPTALLRRPAHRRRGIHRVARHRPAGRDQPRPRVLRGPGAARCRRRPRCSAALYRYLREADPAHFQPMNANFGLLRAAATARQRRSKRRESQKKADWLRAQRDFARWTGRCDRLRFRASPASPVVEDFLRYLEKERKHSPNTVKAYARDLAAFADFCDRHYGGDRGLGRRRSAGAARLPRRAASARLAKRSAARALSAVRSLLPLPAGASRRRANPASAPPGSRKLEKRLPGYLDRDAGRRGSSPAPRRWPAPTTSRRLRDLAMLELFYSTGLRLSELLGLDLDRSTCCPTRSRCCGKGRKERIVPVGCAGGAGAAPLSSASARRWRRLPGADRRAVFVGRRGRRLTARTHPAAWCTGCSTPSARTACAPTRCATPSPPTCSTPAPTCGRCRSCWATRRSSTTQIYTHTSVERLKQVYQPGASTREGDYDETHDDSRHHDPRRPQGRPAWPSAATAR